jgi:5-amino-6-(5-phosphoribosylamino)uracil reductase
MKIITNTAMSLDGKIAVVKDKPIFIGSDEDRRRMSLIRAKADAILVGGNSFRNWPRPLLPRPEHRAWNFISKPVLNVVVSHSMRLVFDDKYLNERCVRPLILTDAQNVDPDFPIEIARFDEGITVRTIVEELGRRNVKTLLIEGGGELIAQFLAEGLVDEIYVTLCPKIIGGTASPPLIEGRRFGGNVIQELRLLESETVGNEVFLHYGIE